MSIDTQPTTTSTVYIINDKHTTNNGQRNNQPTPNSLLHSQYRNSQPTHTTKCSTTNDNTPTLNIQRTTTITQQPKTDNQQPTANDHRTIVNDRQRTTNIQTTNS